MVSRNISPKPRLEEDEKDVVIVSKTRVKCDGGGGALGHPVTWLDMGDDGYVICKYCDRVFKLDPKAAAAGAH
jgi:uncharacterized Zn-finger protein